MKTFLNTLAIFAIFLAPLAAQSNYETGMQQGMQLLENEEYLMAQNIFERIAGVETDQWVPLYYAANVLVIQSFEIEDQAMREATLDKAKTLIAEAHERSPDNAELLTLEGMLYTSYVAFDPGTYGMIYSAKISALHERALAADPDNPRAMINAVEWEMGSARFFGRELGPYCERAAAIVDAFDTYESEVPFAPSQGREKAQRIAASCDE